MFLCLRTHVSWVCCKVMSVSTNNFCHVRPILLTQSYCYIPTISIFFPNNFPFTYIRIISYIPRKWPFCFSNAALFLFPFFLKSPLLLSVFFSPWGLCSQLSRAWTGGPLYPVPSLANPWPCGLRVGGPSLQSSQLVGCSHGITLQLQWEVSGAGKRDKTERGERERAQNGHG